MPEQMSGNLERTLQDNPGLYFWLVGLGTGLGITASPPLSLHYSIQTKRSLVRTHVSPNLDNPSFLVSLRIGPSLRLWSSLLH